MTMPAATNAAQTARNFWNEEFFPWFRDNAYGAGGADGNPFYAVRRRHVLELIAARRPGRALDVGCGSGEVTGDLHARGWTVSGLDFAPNMVALARSRLAARDMAAVSVDLGDAAALPAYAGGLDLLLCLGPVEFLDAEQTARFYRDAARLLAPGGSLIVAHANALFDLFSVDGYTADFLADLCRDAGADPRHDRLLREELHRVLDAPPSGIRPLRERVSVRADNPLEMGEFLASFGYTLADTIYYRFYAAPPRIARAQPTLVMDAAEADRTLARNWRGMFLASGFITHSIRQS